MSDQNKNRKYSKDEILQIIKEFADKSGQAPSLKELRAKHGVTQKAVAKLFGNYGRALQECGVEATGMGHRVDMPKLFEEWARVVRKLGRLPTVAEFEIHSKYSCGVPMKRFAQWSKVPAGMMEFAEENGLAAGWEDVIELVRKKYPGGMKRASTSTTQDGLSLKPKILPGRHVYGECSSDCLLVFAPTNEMGVIAFFCSIALKLGFLILWIGGQFPDCEVMREIEPQRWQKVLIQFEFHAHNFFVHGHDAEKCDILVCWENDWEKCPLEVLELKPYFFAAKNGNLKADLR